MGRLAQSGGQGVGARDGQGQELVRDAQDQLHAVNHAQLVMQPVEIGMDSVRGDAEVGRNGGFGEVIEDATDDLDLPAGQIQRAADFLPGLGGEDG